MKGRNGVGTHHAKRRTNSISFRGNISLKYHAHAQLVHGFRLGNFIAPPCFGAFPGKSNQNHYCGMDRPTWQAPFPAMPKPSRIGLPWNSPAKFLQPILGKNQSHRFSSFSWVAIGSPSPFRRCPMGRRASRAVQRNNPEMTSIPGRHAIRRKSHILTARCVAFQNAVLNPAKFH